MLQPFSKDQMQLGNQSPRLPAALPCLGRIALRGATPKHVPTIKLECLYPFACNSNPRGRTKWYGVYTEEQYQAQRQSDERARWAAGVRTLTNNQSQAAWDESLLDPPALLGGVTVVIISPRKPVTVGTVARACGSFECEDLRIVMPRQESYITRRHAKSASKGAQYILYRAGHYDSIAEATADCDVRIAFTRWTQASSPHVYKVDITGLTSHPAVQRTIAQPLTGWGNGSGDVGAANASRPPSVPWSESAAAAAAAAEARLMMATVAPAPPPAPPLGGNGVPNGTMDQAPHRQQQQQQQREEQEQEPAVAVAVGLRRVGPYGQQQERQQHHHQDHGFGGGSNDDDDNDDDDDTKSGIAAASVAWELRGCSGNSSSNGRISDAGRRNSSSASSTDSSSGGGIDGGRPTGRSTPRVALVFGREELGMSDEEVDSCEVCCSIPIGRLQESLSLSHAVSIALCALYQARLQHLSTAVEVAAAAPETAAAGEDEVGEIQRLQPCQTIPCSASAVARGIEVEAELGLGPGVGVDGVVECHGGADARVSYTVNASTGAVRDAAAAVPV